ncbi:MAG TPA: RHS repeat-associated core domain-containing protein, partial [Flavobacterium sp.]|nr:RHS repeat-associated core domain-containing protein [Flavobacterium sp.]
GMEMGPMMAPPAETLIYFYHPDHLGTATFLTDGNGQLYQFYLNLPFGETMAEQHSLTEDYETPYKFNAKEMDRETGYYYYGARYYNPEISIWLSVDPLAIYNPISEIEFYGDGDHNGGVFNSQNLNVYGYCYQNPIKYYDPNGKQSDAVYTLPSNPNMIDADIWEAYTPEKHTGHSMYWRNKDSGIFLVWDNNGTDSHYHLYENSRFNIRLDPNGVKSGTSVNGMKVSRGAARFHLKAGATINFSAISKTLNSSLRVFGTLTAIWDMFKIAKGDPSAMFSHFNPDGKLHTAYGISSAESLISENLYYEMTSKDSNGDISVEFFNSYYYDHDSGRYRGTGKYSSGTMILDKEDGTYIYQEMN